MNPVLLRNPLGKCVFAGVVFVAAVAAQATPVTFTFKSFTHSKTIDGNYGGEAMKLYMGNINISLYSGTDSANSVNMVAYCMEIAEDLNIGQTYSGYATSDLVSAGISASQAKLVSILYDFYYAGPDTQDWNSVNTSAFQLALWELTHDDDGSLWSEDGNFFLYDDKHLAQVADSYLQEVYSAANDGYAPYSELVALTNMGSQDLIVLGALIPGGGGGPVAIPFGVNPLPGLAIVGLFAWRRMRKRQGRRLEGGAEA